MDPQGQLAVAAVLSFLSSLDKKDWDAMSRTLSDDVRIDTVVPGIGDAPASRITKKGRDAAVAHFSRPGTLQCRHMVSLAESVDGRALVSGISSRQDNRHLNFVASGECDEQGLLTRYSVFARPIEREAADRG